MEFTSLDELESNYAAIRGRIPPAVTLIAVSKVQPVSAIERLYQLGQRDFGENYVQELLEKAQELEARGLLGIRWHFLGHLQNNKVKALLPVVHAIHSVDSLRIAEEISKRATQAVCCFLEVNLDGERSKSGFGPGEVIEVAQKVGSLPQIDLRGLMTIPAPRTGAESQAVPFRTLRELERRCRPATRGELSMGMSEDFEVAIAEGSTLVRVGTRLFGQRLARRTGG